MDNSAAINIARTVIAESESGGKIQEWFTERAERQAVMRQRFAVVSKGLIEDPQSISAEAVELLGFVNTEYSTRLPKDLVPGLFEDFLSVCSAEKWFFSKPPSLYNCRDNSLSDIARVYISMLRKNSKRSGKKAYALLSKWLHFCYPETFAVYDQSIAASVLSWSKIALVGVGTTETEHLQFDIDSRHWARYWDDTGWYRGLLRFQCYVLRSDPEQLPLMLEAAGEIETMLRAAADAPDARVTAVDLVDCLAWIAKGDRMTLGLMG